MNKKVLIYNSTLFRGGTETFAIKLAEILNTNGYEVDAIIKNGDEFDEFNYKKLQSFSNNVFLAKGGFVKRLLQLKKYFKTNKNKYNFIHINATSQGAGLISYFAKKYGKIKNIIFHSHMGGNDNGKDLVDKIGDKLLKKYSNAFVACSPTASKYMYGEKFLENNNITIINNAVDTDKFDFNPKTKKDMREKFGIKDDTFVLLHNGRFVHQKNHDFLIDIFERLVQKNPNSLMFLLSNGELENQMKQKAKTLKLDDKIYFMGNQSDVAGFLNMADCFVMPSHHEGLPFAAVEAQASGIACVLSNNIEKQTKLTDSTIFVELEKGADFWADEILKFKTFKRVSTKQTIEQKGFGNQTITKQILKLYE